MLMAMDAEGHTQIFKSDEIVGDVANIIRKTSTDDTNLLLITSNSFTRRGVTDALLRALGPTPIKVIDSISPNPSVQEIDTLLTDLRSSPAFTIMALGGGSVLDTAKVIKIAMANQLWCCDAILQQADNNTSTEHRLIAIPTTAGTGAEVTPFATLWDPEAGMKYSVTGRAPDIALLNSALTLTLDRTQTLYPALDALSHALESLWNKQATPTSQACATHAIHLIQSALPCVLSNLEDQSAREKLQLAACYAGRAITETKTALAHAISYPFTLHYGVPHGLACSFTLASIIRFYGSSALQLAPEMANSLLTLIDDLKLPAEMARFTGQQDIDLDILNNLNAARTRNFMAPITRDAVLTIVQDALQSVPALS